MLLGWARRSVRVMGRFAAYLLRMIGFTDVRAFDPSLGPGSHNGGETPLAPHERSSQTKGSPLRGRAPRVLMLGLRGLPNVQGGVEKHVEQLALQLLKSDWTVDVVARSPYVKAAKPYVWNGIRVVPLWSPTSPRLEAITHTFVSVLYAAWTRPDILHIHAVGPSLYAPLARLFGLNVVVTHHGFDYDREKWGFVAKKALRLGEYFGMKFGHARIAVAKNIAETMENRYSVPVKFIPNGVSIATASVDTNVLSTFGLVPKRYIVIVGRIVQEKRQLDLIEAFVRLALPDMKLVLVGKGDEASNYAERVFAAAARVENVVCTGQKCGDDLATLYRNAALFVLPSSHEGMPIAVLEALAYRVPVVVSDIPANLALQLRCDSYFPLGDVEALASAMKSMLEKQQMDDAEEPGEAIDVVYSWSKSCDQTLDIYNTVLGDRSGGQRGPVLPLHPVATLTEKTP